MANDGGEPGVLQDVPHVFERTETVVVRGYRTNLCGLVRVVYGNGSGMYGGSAGNRYQTGSGERDTDGVHHQLCPDGQLEGDRENDV